MNNNQDFDQFDDLIDELQQSDERPYPPRAFKQNLRADLLNQYDQPRFSLANLGRLVGTAVAFTVLALVVYFSWASLSQQPAAISAHMGTVDVPGRDEFIVYDQLRLEFPMWVELDAGWAEMTAESWQSLDGTFFRGEVVDANDKQRVFVQGDGQFLWRGTYDASVEQMETISLHYFDVYHALAQAEGWAGTRTTPPFYDDAGWDGLVQSVLRLDWQCSGSACVEKYLIEPPLGVNSQGGMDEPYGFAISEIGDETTGNGRSLTTYRIDYSPNQDGVPDSKYRLVKLDSATHTVVEVADYDGDTLLRRLERVSHQLMTSADLPEDQFTQLPAEMGVSFVLPEGRVTTETPLLAEPNGAAEAALAEGTPVTLSGLMNNQLSVVQNGITWQYVTVDGGGQGWVDEASLQWPLTSDGQLVDLDTSGLPTAVPVPTQLTILHTYQTELEAILPLMPDEELPRLEQMLANIKTEIARLEYLDSFDSLGRDDIEVVSSGLDQLTFDFDGELTLTAFNIEEGMNELTLTLDWLVQERPSADYQLFFHLRKGQDTVVAQIDQPLKDGNRPTTAWTAGEQIRTTLTLNLPNALIDDRYDLIVGLYDAASGARLPVTVDNSRQSADGGTAVWLTDWFVEHKESHFIAVVSGTDSNGLTLRSEPTGQEIGILEEGSAVILNDDPILESDGLFWQSVSTPIGKGWVVVDYLDYPEGYTPTETLSPENDVWLISATQHARSSVDATVTLEITVGYRFESDEEVTLKPLYANPNWESANGGRIPMDGLSEAITLTEKSGTHTITFSESPAVMRQIVGTDQPVLVMQLGYLSEDENGRRELNILAMPTLTGFVIDLIRTEEMQYFAVDSTAIISGTDGNGLTLRNNPDGQMLGILEEGALVFLLNEPLQESQGLFWQLVQTPDGQTGWVAADFLDYPVGYTPNQLWITKAIQLPRSSSDEAITLEVTVEYMLVTAEEAVLSLSFIHPEWGKTSLEGYRYPNFNALGDKYPVQAGTGSVTITATIEPTTITSAINSNEFELMTRLWATNEDSQPTPDLILMGFDNGMTFNVQSVDEITYP
ncbi:MAG: SH3 domain-containing protein [Anaerolineaceae bacterium]|nr:SH3 domain-containing protein [Anaerolineaceae bacterium]